MHKEDNLEGHIANIQKYKLKFADFIMGDRIFSQMLIIVGAMHDLGYAHLKIRPSSFFMNNLIRVNENTWSLPFAKLGNFDGAMKADSTGRDYYGEIGYMPQGKFSSLQFL